MKEKARELLRKFKGDRYTFGVDILNKIGKITSEYGKNVLFIANQGSIDVSIKRVLQSLKDNQVKIVGNRIFSACKPNTPREDVYHVESYILHFPADCIIVMGGGSNIDCVKAANVLATLGSVNPDIDTYFGTGIVTESLKKTGKSLLPLIAIQTSASSASHLTKYSNITDPVIGQKKLIVDEAIIPDRAIFDYSLTRSMSPSLTIDGVLDGISHILEVFYGIKEEKFQLVSDIVITSLELIFQNTQKALKSPNDLAARESLGLATDLGGYAIMIGGTNGAHLNSFSLVDITSHGRACGIINPYYTVFFAPAIERQLKIIGRVLQNNDLISDNPETLFGRELGIAIARGLVNFNKSIGAPYTLAGIPGFSDKYITKALEAAKNPQLEMKLRNMPVPLNAGLVDEYMAPILQAAKTGDFLLIKNL